LYQLFIMSTCKHSKNLPNIFSLTFQLAVLKNYKIRADILICVKFDHQEQDVSWIFSIWFSGQFKMINYMLSKDNVLSWNVLLSMDNIVQYLRHQIRNSLINIIVLFINPQRGCECKLGPHCLWIYSTNHTTLIPYLSFCQPYQTIPFTC
jgi:hypothetical protein